jgi:hypothetical protein
MAALAWDVVSIMVCGSAQREATGAAQLIWEA